MLALAFTKAVGIHLKRASVTRKHDIITSEVRLEIYACLITRYIGSRLASDYQNMGA